jgi:hypothetical protein
LFNARVVVFIPVFPARVVQINNLHQYNTSRAREEAEAVKIHFLTGAARKGMEIIYLNCSINLNFRESHHP